MPRLLLACSVTLGLAVSLSAADWPQWMGPNRDDVWPEAGILKAFPKGGPKVLWRAEIGSGYAGPAVAGGRVYVADKLLARGAVEPKDPFAGDKMKLPAHERVLCFDAKTGGKPLWVHEYPVTYSIQYPCGPRCTPAVQGGKVYSLGAMGDLHCLDAGSGKVVWSKNFPKDYQAKVPVWGFAGHPLIYKNLLICLVGGDGTGLVAFDKDTGQEKWRALAATDPGYNSPALIEAGGVTQLVVWTPKKLSGLNPDTGARYWDVPLEPEHGMSIMSPRKDGDYLFAAGIGNVGVTLELDRDKPAVKRQVWRAKGGPNPKTGVFPINMTPFVEGGVIYAADQPGVFRAVELTTGKRLWESCEPVFGPGKPPGFKAPCGTAFVVKNADRFFLFAETGDLVIARLSPKGYVEISRAHLLAPTGVGFGGRTVVWSHPAFAEKCVFARNDKELVCAWLGQ